MKGKRKISFITTVFNEEKTIDRFLDSLLRQTKLPHEIIIVDGGSSDGTIAGIRNQESGIRKKRIKFKLLIKQGNRSVGRNEAIKHATGNIITCSDSGNILDKKWIENIIKPFKDGNIDVVAGYYKSLSKNLFQKCLTPYVLVMPDKIDPENFLPATRSVAFTKLIWKKVGGFPEEFSHNEDYVFANRLKEKGAEFFFSKDAIVYWLPRSTFKETFIMFFRFALGDAESGFWRTSVLLLFARYFLAFYFVFLSILYKSLSPVILLSIFFVIYIIWSVKKNYKYVESKEAIKILALLQLTADASVLSGTIIGLLKKIKEFSYLSYIKQNKFLFLVTAVYVGVLLQTLKWGIPNIYHPFPYHMDEWHQLQAVANTFRYGTPNIEGSANGTMFHFILTGFYLILFTISGFINPFELQIDNPLMRERIFEVLRLQAILFGSLSVFLIYKIAQLINVSKRFAILLFIFTPIWLMLSGYFKYDIALIFWILLSLLLLLRFAKNPTNKNFILAAFPSALAISVKVSAIPFLIIYPLSFFWFKNLWTKNIKFFFIGIGIFVGIILFFGIPDTLFGKGNIGYYFYNNIENAQNSPYVQFNQFSYLFFYNYPALFGRGLTILFIFSCIFWALEFQRRGIKKYKLTVFLFFVFIMFLFSLLPLKLAAAGNRSLVLLPFLVIIIAGALKKSLEISRLRTFVIVVIAALFIAQLFESYAWLYVKLAKSPQESASAWLKKNITQGSTIGIENIPIYQFLPDIIEKEFYFHQYGINKKNNFRYNIIDSNSKKLPNLIVVTNDDPEMKFLKHSPKKSLVLRLEKEGYKKKASFTPDFTLYKFVNSDLDYYTSNIITAPLTISVYIK